MNGETAADADRTRIARQSSKATKQRTQTGHGHCRSSHRPPSFSTTVWDDTFPDSWRPVGGNGRAASRAALWTAARARAGPANDTPGFRVKTPRGGACCAAMFSRAFPMPGGVQFRGSGEEVRRRHNRWLHQQGPQRRAAAAAAEARCLGSSSAEIPG
eukprot:gene16780-biopygen15849